MTDDDYSKLSNCPYPPSDPRWQDWQMRYIRAQGLGGPDDLLAAQHERMDAVKAATPQPTEAQLKAERTMRQVDAYNDWVERGQPDETKAPIGWLYDADGSKHPIMDIKFSPIDPPSYITQRQVYTQMQLYGSQGRGRSLWAQNYMGPPPDPVPRDPDILDAIHTLANFAHTTVDQIMSAFGIVKDAFADAIATVMVDFSKAVKDILEAIERLQEIREARGRAFLIDYPEVWDEDYIPDQLDQRPRIAMHTWLQFDSI